MVSPAPLPQLPLSPTDRRLQAEWALLGQLVALNPARLFSPASDDTTIRVTLAGTPGLSPGSSMPIQTHRLRIVYPRFFPALPLELYLQMPAFHPNIHPETGFVCLWDQHRTANTIEHALHKTAAMLGWRLFNLDPRHTMQPSAAALAPMEREALAQKLHAPALCGVRLPAGYEPVPDFRRRLS